MNTAVASDYKFCKAVKGDSYACFSIKLQREVDKKYYWLDVSLDERFHDVEIDWNQYIFYNSDQDDVERKAVQETGEEFEAAAECVCAAIVEKNLLAQNDCGEWYCPVKKEDWKSYIIQ